MRPNLPPESGSGRDKKDSISYEEGERGSHMTDKKNKLFLFEALELRAELDARLKTLKKMKYPTKNPLRNWSRPEYRFGN